MGWVSTERNHDEQPITVGVIDDDPMICQMMRLILEMYLMVISGVQRFGFART